MAWLEHLKTVHSHTRHATKAFLLKAAEHHPILTTVLALVGGAVALHTVSAKKPAGTPTTTGGTT